MTGIKLLVGAVGFGVTMTAVSIVAAGPGDGGANTTVAVPDSPGHAPVAQGTAVRPKTVTRTASPQSKVPVTNQPGGTDQKGGTPTRKTVTVTRTAPPSR